MAHMPDKLFEEAGDGQDRQRPEQAKMGSTGAERGEAKQVPKEPKIDTCSEGLETRAHKPAILFGDDREEAEGPDWGTEDIAAAQTESVQETPDQRKHIETVIETTTAKLGERMQTQLQDMVQQALREAQTSLETLVSTAQERGAEAGRAHTRGAQGRRQRGDERASGDEAAGESVPGLQAAGAQVRGWMGRLRTPGVANAEEEEVEIIIAGDNPPPHTHARAHPEDLGGGP